MESPSKQVVDERQQFIEKTFPFYSDVCKAIDPVLAPILVQQEISTEALNSNIFGRIFVAVADTFTGLLNTFKTNAFKSTKALKRSELREFVESNRMKTSIVYKLDYEKVKNFKCEVPANMADTYLEAVTSVDAIYKKLNALNTAKSASQAFTEIFKGLSGNDSKLGTLVTETADTLMTAIKDSRETVLECQKHFNGKFEAQAIFSKVFPSIKEFQVVTDTLIEMEYRLQDVRELTEIIQQIEDTLKGIVNAGKDTALPLTQKDALNLGSAAKSLALIFDSYGLAATRQMTLEHNHVININRLYAEVR